VPEPCQIISGTQIAAKDTPIRQLVGNPPTKAVNTRPMARIMPTGKNTSVAARADIEMGNVRRKRRCTTTGNNTKI
jgi:hypothetical protein